VNAAAGVYDVVGLTNWRSAPAVQTLSFADKLGLGAGRQYLVFDFWNQRLLGTSKDSLQTEVGAHDTRVLLIHPLLDHPQLMGNSRHISGAYSISDLSWDGAVNRLQGTSETVAGEQYTLFVHVPQGYKQVGAKTSAGVARVQEGSETGMVTVAFQGNGAPVQWEVEFATR